VRAVDEDKKTERVKGIEELEDAERRTRALGSFPGDEADDFSLIKLGDGIIRKLIDQEMVLVADNILDVNTSATEKREIVLKITVLPEGNRQGARLLYESSSKLAKHAPSVSTIGIGQDMAGNIVLASHDVRQGKLGI
jgi:hypothetical protein